MDFLPIVVLIVFVLVGGIIAVIADELGRRIGKRRLTLHRRIRPKHSARILTFLSGMMITVITIFLVGLSSSDMRTLLLRGRFAIRDLQNRNDQLRSEQDSLLAQRSALTKENSRLAATNSTLSDTNKQLANKVSAAESKRDTAQNQASAAVVRANAASTRTRQINARLVVVQHRFETALAQLSSKQTQVAGYTKAIASRKKELATLQTKYDYIFGEYTDLVNKNQQLTMQADSLQKQLTELGPEIAAKNESIKQLTSQKSQLESDIAGAREAYNKAKQEYDTISIIAGQVATQIRDNPLMFARGEELTRLDVPAGVSKDIARQLVEHALSQARNVAKAHGAKQSDRINYADLVDQRVNDGQILSTEAQKDILASQLAGFPEDQVLIVISPFNSFIDEGVIVGFAHKANPVVYSQGQVLAEMRVDGHQDPNKVLQALDGIATLIRTRALKNGMIPIQKGQMSLGSVSSEDILVLYNQIRSATGTVWIQAKAKRQTRAADPLDLDFAVR